MHIVLEENASRYINKERFENCRHIFLNILPITLPVIGEFAPLYHTGYFARYYNVVFLLPNQTEASSLWVGNFSSQFNEVTDVQGVLPTEGEAKQCRKTLSPLEWCPSGGPINLFPVAQPSDLLFQPIMVFPVGGHYQKQVCSTTLREAIDTAVPEAAATALPEQLSLYQNLLLSLYQKQLLPSIRFNRYNSTRGICYRSA